jgi:hypothetical protein
MAYQQHYLLILVAGPAERRMSSEQATPLQVHLSGSAVQADYRSHENVAPPQQLSVPAGWRLIVSSRGIAQ